MIAIVQIQERYAEVRCLPETLFPTLPPATKGHQLAPYAYLTVSASNSESVTSCVALSAKATRRHLGSCTWGWGLPPCGLLSRMLVVYETSERSPFSGLPAKKRLHVLAACYSGSNNYVHLSPRERRR